MRSPAESLVTMRFVPIVFLLVIGCEAEPNTKLPPSIAPSGRSGDTQTLAAALRRDPRPSVDELSDEFNIVTTHHHDYGGDFERVGGDAAPIMHFFFADDGTIYRLHPQRGLVELTQPPDWLLPRRHDSE